MRLFICKLLETASLNTIRLLELLNQNNIRNLTPCPMEVSMKDDQISIKSEERKSNHQKNPIASQNIRRRYSDFFDFAPVGYFTFNRDGLILDVNPHGALLLGTDKPSSLNQHLSNFLSPDSKKVFERHSHQLFETRQKKICDVKLLNGNQDARWIQLESVVVQDGGDSKAKFRTVIKEVTNRRQMEDELRKNRDKLEQRVAKHTAELETANEKLRRRVFECQMAEEALRESEQKYSTLVEDALIGVYIIKDGIIEFANDKFAEIYGYEKNELIGMQSLDLVHPEDRPMIEEMRENRLKGQKVLSEYEIRGLKKNGDTIWVMRSFSLINYKDGPRHFRNRFEFDQTSQSRRCPAGIGQRTANSFQSAAVGGRKRKKTNRQRTA